MVEFFLENQTQVCTKKRGQKGYVIDYVMCIIWGQDTQSGIK